MRSALAFTAGALVGVAGLVFAEIVWLDRNLFPITRRIVAQEKRKLREARRQAAPSHLRTIAARLPLRTFQTR